MPETEALSEAIVSAQTAVDALIAVEGADTELEAELNWFQQALDTALRDYGWPTAVEGEDEWDSQLLAPRRSKRPRPSQLQPTIPPKRSKRPRPSQLPPMLTPDHGELARSHMVISHYDSHCNEVYMKKQGWCAECMAVASEAGTMTHERALMPDGSWVKKPMWACKVCKAYLCKGCKDAWHTRLLLLAREGCSPDACKLSTRKLVRHVALGRQ